MAKNSNQGVEVLDDTPAIETVSENVDFRTLASNEAFMNEIVTVLVHSSTNENEPPHIIVNCNGTNQPIVRGIPTKLRRKYVEILARMKETRYNQITPNPAAPDVTHMHARHGLVYPFELLEDVNPRGRAWLTNVLAEPA